jgi:hypothetical protein
MPDAMLSPPAPSQAPTGPNPMETHVKVIGILDIVFGCLAALGALVLLLIFGIGSAVTGANKTPAWLPGFLAGLGIVFSVFAALFAVLFILAGTKLVGHRRSGKVWGIVAACVQLLSFPLGTALGIYALVILTKRETEQLLVN